MWHRHFSVIVLLSIATMCTTPGKFLFFSNNAILRLHEQWLLDIFMCLWDKNIKIFHINYTGIKQTFQSLTRSDFMPACILYIFYDKIDRISLLTSAIYIFDVLLRVFRYIE